MRSGGTRLGSEKSLIVPWQELSIYQSWRDQSLKLWTRFVDPESSDPRRFFGRAANFAVLALSAFVLAGCINRMPTVPALGDSGEYAHGKVVWHDLVTPNIGRAKQFYTDLFGWTYEDLSRGYTLVRNNGRLIGGFAQLDARGQQSHWLALVSVNDVNRTVAETTAAGGDTLLAPFDLPDRGRVAVLEDPQGAAFGVVHATAGDPVDRQPATNEWLWNEVWTDDLSAASRFYQQLLGYVEAERTLHGVQYHYFKRDGKPRLGLIEKPSPAIGNTWVAYVRVASVADIAEKVEALGGALLMAPRPDVRKGKVAIIADPNGAGLVIQEWHL